MALNRRDYLSVLEGGKECHSTSQPHLSLVDVSHWEPPHDGCARVAFTHGFQLTLPLREAYRESVVYSAPMTGFGWSTFSSKLRRHRIRRVVDLRLSPSFYLWNLRGPEARSAFESEGIEYLSIPEAANPFLGKRPDLAWTLHRYEEYLTARHDLLTQLLGWVEDGPTVLLAGLVAEGATEPAVLFKALAQRCPHLKMHVLHPGE